MNHVVCDFSEFRDFLEKIERAGKGEFRQEFELFLEGIGNEFLRIVEDEIIRRQVTDTRELLASFHKGDANNVWEMQEGGLSLEVGTNVKYAKVTGLKALYLYYCYRLGYLPKKKPHKPLSPEMREAIRKLDRYAQQITLIYKEHLNTLDDVNAFISMSTEQIKMLDNERKHIYNKLRRCMDEETKVELISKRKDYTSVIRRIRRDIKTAKSIMEDNPKIKQNIKAEQNLQHQHFAVKHKQKVRYYDYYR